MICIHIGSSSLLMTTSVHAPLDVMIALTPVNSIQAAADILFSPVLRKFPNLRFALSEGGIGWIPYFLERVDYTYQQRRAWTGQDFGDKLPSQVFRDHFVTCFIDDDVDRMTPLNAMRVFSFDPFAPPAQGALHRRLSPCRSSRCRRVVAPNWEGVVRARVDCRPSEEGRLVPQLITSLM